MDILKSYTERWRMRVLLGTMVALGGADGIISRYLVTHGFAYESNPFMRAWINQDIFLALKIVGAFLAAFVLWKIYERAPRASFSVTLFFVVFYTALNFWSLSIWISRV